jgi:hypothetical protein
LSNCLPGMKKISEFCNRSESTILLWIRTKGFPAVKITGGWESDKNLIEAWKVEQIKSGVKDVYGRSMSSAKTSRNR